MESPDSVEGLLAAAASESLERIRRDRESTPIRVRPLLDYIRDHLFDPRLDVNQLKRACDIRDNTVPLRFHATLERTPHRYIEDRRLETACRLLCSTDLRVWQVAEAVGYSGIQVFSRAFIRWSGERPSEYRKRRRNARAAWRTRRRDGNANESSAWPAEAIRELQAEVIEKALLDLPPAARRSVLSRLRLPTPILVQRLCQASRGAAAGVRRLELARLAVAASEALDTRRCDVGVRLRWTVEAWTTLADATVPGD